MVGANTREAVSVSWGAINTGFAGIVTFGTTVNVNTQTFALAMVDLMDSTIDQVTSIRGRIGSFQNRFESSVRTQNIAIENVTASESRLRDVDMAQEMTNFSKLQILQQSGTAMLGQANSLPQSVLRLLS